MPPPPIIIKKRISHGGHHGGAWKVAYADFVTAMMALFIVLWLLNTSKPVQEAVAGYFRDPSGVGKKAGTQAGTGETVRITKENMADLKEVLQRKIERITNLEQLRKNIEMTITAEGLRIELLESDKGTFFDLGSPNLKPSGQEILSLLAAQLGKVPNHVSIEGHTDAKPYSGKSGYSNWELSADRANAARRLMEQSGLRPDQVAQVRGFADRRLRNPKEPLEALNRRVSIIVQYLGGDGPAETPNAKEGGYSPEEREKAGNAAATQPPSKASASKP
jgi:chemotaxis protein MotB